MRLLTIEAIIYCESYLLIFIFIFPEVHLFETGVNANTVSAELLTLFDEKLICFQRF